MSLSIHLFLKISIKICTLASSQCSRFQHLFSPSSFEFPKALAIYNRCDLIDLVKDAVLSRCRICQSDCSFRHIIHLLAVGGLVRSQNSSSSGTTSSTLQFAFCRQHFLHLAHTGGIYGGAPPEISPTLGLGEDIRALWRSMELTLSGHQLGIVRQKGHRGYDRKRRNEWSDHIERRHRDYCSVFASVWACLVVASLSLYREFHDGEQILASRKQHPESKTKGNLQKGGYQK